MFASKSSVQDDNRHPSSGKDTNIMKDASQISYVSTGSKTVLTGENNTSWRGYLEPNDVNPTNHDTPLQSYSLANGMRLSEIIVNEKKWDNSWRASGQVASALGRVYNSPMKTY